MDHNLVCGEGDQRPLFQRTLSYNNIPPEVMDTWRAHAAEQSQNLLEQLDSWLEAQDRDVSGKEGDGLPQQSFRTGVSVFYFEEPVLTEKTETASGREKMT